MCLVRSVALALLVMLCGAAVAQDGTYQVSAIPLGSFLVSPAQAQVGCVPNPNLTGPPFVNGCPFPPSALNGISPPANVVDLSNPNYGTFVCGADNTASVTAAMAAIKTKGGGTIMAPCNFTMSSQVLIPDRVRITGEAAVGATNPLFSSLGAGAQNVTLTCTLTGSSCLRVNGFGIEIDHFNLVQPQPTPPSTGNSWPGFITYTASIIDTSATSSWGDLFIHNVNCVPCTSMVDLEGTSNYSGVFNGTMIQIRDYFCQPCLGTAIIAHRIDASPLVIEDGEYTPTNFYFSYPAVGNQLRTTGVGLLFQYVAAAQVHHIRFFANEIGWQFKNDTVTNNFGALTFAESALSADDIQFNQVCQAIAGQGNGTNTSAGGQATDGTFMNYAKFTQIDIWADQSGFQCAKGKKLIQLETNQGNVSFAHMNVYTADQVFALGCGTVGTASCPAGGPGGNLVVRLDDMDITQYGQFTAGTPFLTAPSNVTVNFGTTNLAGIRPFAGAGNIIAAGLDGTLGKMGVISAGGGSKAVYGAAILNPGAVGLNNGFLDFFDTTNTRQGFVGSNSSTVSVGSDTGGVTLNAQTGFPVAVTGSGFFPPTVPVASLPACNATSKSWEFEVTDASGTPAYLSNVTTGGGSAFVLVVCNGTNWQAH